MLALSALNKVQGMLFGLAFGDALGARTEFLPVSEIVRRWPPAGPWELEGTPALVTDDTQMALAVARALLDCGTGGHDAERLEDALRNRFVEWLHDPRNNRAPGRTCMAACRSLAQGSPWLLASRTHSCGCGANMRVAPVAALHASRSAIAQFQAAMTHGHPRALAASDLTMHAIRLLLERDVLDMSEFVAELRAYADGQRTVYHADWLNGLWRRAEGSFESADAYIASGWDACLDLLDKAVSQLRQPAYGDDPCNATGEGWVADEAFATALLCFLASPDEPRRVLQRAATTRGDSDSIACIAGAMAGALHGTGAWPKDWVRRIEYRDDIEGLAAALSML